MYIVTSPVYISSRFLSQLVINPNMTIIFLNPSCNGLFPQITSGFLVLVGHCREVKLYIYFTGYSFELAIYICPNMSLVLMVCFILISYLFVKLLML